MLNEVFKLGSSALFNYFKRVSFLPSFAESSKFLHLSSAQRVLDDRKFRHRRSLSERDEGTEGEASESFGSLIQRRSDMFPTERTPDMLFNGIPFSKIPICNIRVSKNNTIITMTDADGKVKLIRSCGIEGFKNTRKGTNVAAQATAISFGTNALNSGFKTVRVRVRGLGPGRMSSIKGLEMAGLSIISITDSTRVSWNPPRPRKQRRL